MSRIVTECRAGLARIGLVAKTAETEKELVDPGAEVQPPWIRYPRSCPWEYKQGNAEYWLVEVFLPFWQGLTPREREDYLQRWPPPDDDWQTYMTEYWV